MINVPYHSVFCMSSLWDRPIHQQYFSENLQDKRVIKNLPPLTFILPLKPVNIYMGSSGDKPLLQFVSKVFQDSHQFLPPLKLQITLAQPLLTYVWFKTCSLKLLPSICTAWILNITHCSLRHEFSGVWILHSISHNITCWYSITALVGLKYHKI